MKRNIIESEENTYFDALQSAIDDDDLQRVESIIQAMHSNANHTHTALNIVAALGKFEMIKYIAQFLNSKGSDLPTLLKRILPSVVQSGNLEAVKYIEQNGVDIIRQESRNPPLIHAVITGRLETAKYILSKGFNLKEIGDRLVIKAISNRRLEILQLLHSSGCNLRANDDEPLLAAADTGDRTIMQYLIDKSADVNAKNGLVLYRLVCTHSHLEALKLAHSNGIKIENLNTPLLLEEIISNEDYHTLLYLSSYFPIPEDETLEAIKSALNLSNQDAVKDFFDKYEFDPLLHRPIISNVIRYNVLQCNLICKGLAGQKPIFCISAFLPDEIVIHILEEALVLSSGTIVDTILPIITKGFHDFIEIPNVSISDDAREYITYAPHFPKSSNVMQ